MTVRTKTIKAKDRTLGLKVSMSPASTQSAAAGCDVAPTGLYWFSDETGAFDQDSEAAYLLLTGPAGPVLGVAAVLGELCGAAVDWSTEWTPDAEDGGAPVAVADGARLVVYATAATRPGALLATATVAGKTLGPIVLTVLREPALTLGWRDFYDVFTATDVVGMTWSANPKDVTADLFTANLAAADGYALPEGGRRIRASFTPDPGEPTTWEIEFTFGSEDDWYLLSTDTMPKTIDIGTAPLSVLHGYFPYLQPTGKLTISVEAYGP